MPACPDGKLLVTAARDSLCVWDPAMESFCVRFWHWRGMVAFTSDAQQMACADYKGIQLFSVPDFAEIRRFEQHRDNVYALTFSPDGKRLASGHDQVVVLWDVATGKQVRTADGHHIDLCACVLGRQPIAGVGQ